MVVLALEHSTSVSSVALLRGARLLASESWEETHVRNQRVFAVIGNLLRQAVVPPSQVDLVAVGLGPGAFSGVRIALSAARGFALPGSVPVVGIASSEALAWDIWQQTGTAPILVVGDARRNMLWLQKFVATCAAIRAESSPQLIPSDRLPTAITPPGILVSPDYIKLAPVFEVLARKNVEILRERRTPRAETVGLLALEKHLSGEAGLPLRPIYLHPPVFVEPRRSG